MGRKKLDRKSMQVRFSPDERGVIDFLCTISGRRFSEVLRIAAREFALAVLQGEVGTVTQEWRRLFMQWAKGEVYARAAGARRPYESRRTSESMNQLFRALDGIAQEVKPDLDTLTELQKEQSAEALVKA